MNSSTAINRTTSITLTPMPPSFNRRHALRSMVAGSSLLPGLLSHMLAESGHSATSQDR